MPGSPGDFADWPAFLAANGIPKDRWNDASAIEAVMRDPEGNEFCV